MFTYEVKKSFVLPVIMVFLCGELIILKDIKNCVGGHILCTFHESDSTDECTLQSVGDDPCGFCGLDGCLTQLLEKKTRWWHYYYNKL